MAVAFTKMISDDNILKYKVTSAGAEAGNLDAAGAATPDMLTDAIPGSPLRAALATAVANQAAARVLAFDRSDLLITMTTRTGAALWAIDADTDGANHLRLTATAAAADALGSYLTIEHRHSLIR